MSGEALDGDRVFLGMESRLEAGSLQPGFYASGRNVRARGGRIETRRGIMKMEWVGEQLGAAPFPLVFPINFSGMAPFVSVYGVGRWDDPDEVEWCIVAGALEGETGKVYAARPGNVMTELDLPVGVEIDGEVSFEQAFDKLFMFRGEDAGGSGSHDVLVMESLDDGFRELEESATPGLELLPNGASGTWVQNRLFVGHGRDLVDVSDSLDPEHVFQATNRFRINAGSSDRLVGVVKFNEQSVVVAKGSSIYVLNNLIADEDGNLSEAYVDEVTREFGFIARRSMVQVGGDLWGLSQQGVRGIRQTEQNKLQGVSLPLSAPMKAVMDRVNWGLASGAAGAYWDSKYYLALPLDDGEGLGVEMVWTDAVYELGSLTINGLVVGRRYRFRFGENDGSLDAGAAGTFANGDQETVEFVATQSSVELTTGAGLGSAVTASLRMLHVGVNNAVIVYDFVRGQWDGFDEGDGLWVKEFVTLEYMGRERLFYLGADGCLSLYEEGFEDEVFVDRGWGEDANGGYLGEAEEQRGIVCQGIGTDILLRGYGLRALQNDGYQKAEMGESRVKMIELALRTWGPEYSIYLRPEGVNEEVAGVEGVTRSRTRYATWGTADWDPSNEDGDHENPYREDYSVVLPEDGIYLGDGVRLDVHQDGYERVRVNGRGQACQVRLECTEGRVQLLRASVVTGGGRKRSGVLV